MPQDQTGDGSRSVRWGAAVTVPMAIGSTLRFPGEPPLPVYTLLAEGQAEAGEEHMDASEGSTRTHDGAEVRGFAHAPGHGLQAGPWAHPRPPNAADRKRKAEAAMAAADAGRSAADSADTANARFAQATQQDDGSGAGSSAAKQDAPWVGVSADGTRE